MLRHLFLFVPLLLLVHVASAVALPACQGTDVSSWSMCHGEAALPAEDKYTGEWRD